MALIADQVVTDRYALWNGDCLDVLADLPDASMHLSIFSPPFATERGGALYHYTSSERDFSNARSYAEFEEHYGFLLRELFRVTMPGRMCCVHCTDIPLSNTGRGDALSDFPGDLIRWHRREGWAYAGRYHVWKDALKVRNRTMTKGLAHKTIVDDSSRCSVASADYLLAFRRAGENPIPIEHPTGFMAYAGEQKIPAELLRYRGWTGDQKQNRYSHWIWQRYANAFWDDIRISRVLPFAESRDEEDEKHVHALQLDVIERALVLWSNPGERVLDPFAGVGSVPYAAVANERFGLGAELKRSYYRQALKNLAQAETMIERQEDLFTSSGVTVDLAGVAVEGA